VYVLSRKAVFDERRIIDMAPGVVPIAAELAVDIDTLTDFLFAEFLLKEKVVTQV
jgi:CMP-N-acetylneuraminic acid synthetase